MTDIKYDTELPFAVIEESGQVSCRFRMIDDANCWIHEVVGAGQVIDTTPKPKIPEGAEFLLVEDEDDSYLIRKVFDKHEPRGYYWFRESDAMAYRADEIERIIGDAEVTVLVRKEAQ